MLSFAQKSNTYFDFFSYFANFMYSDSFFIYAMSHLKLSWRIQMSTVLDEAIKLFQKAYIYKDFLL